jgi:hypothetical protein
MAPCTCAATAAATTSASEAPKFPYLVFFNGYRGEEGKVERPAKTCPSFFFCKSRSVGFATPPPQKKKKKHTHTQHMLFKK